MTLPRTANAALPSAPFKTAARAQPVFCYAVSAEASPGLLPRVIGLFAKRDLVPRRCHAATGGADGSDLEIDLQGGRRGRAVWRRGVLRCALWLNARAKQASGFAYLSGRFHQV